MCTQYAKVQFTGDHADGVIKTSQVQGPLVLKCGPNFELKKNLPMLPSCKEI